MLQILWQSVGFYWHFFPFLLRIHRNCYFRTSGQNSDIAVRFIDPDFSKESNNQTTFSDKKSAIFLYFSLFDLMTLNMYHSVLARRSGEC